MCQYSSQDGFAADWHLVHLGSRAQEAQVWSLSKLQQSSLRAASLPATSASGRTSTSSPCANSKLHSLQGARVGIQLAHAGRKGSMSVPFPPQSALASACSCPRGWLATRCASAVPFSSTYAIPQPLDQAASTPQSSLRQAAHRASRQASTLSRSTPPMAISSTSSSRPRQPAHRCLRRQFSEPHPPGP